MTRRYLSRRTFLRGSLAGAGLALALPPLDAMLNLSGAYADGMGDNPFFGLFYWANGTPWHSGHGAQQGEQNRPDLWTPSNTGQGFTASELLTPLARHNVSIATGLQPHTQIPPAPPGQGDGHMRGFMVALTGDRPKTNGFDHASHSLTALRPSLDQVVADHPRFYTAPPRFKSLEVSVSQARFHDYGHWNAISYNGPDSLNLPIQSAGRLFDRLFDVPPDNAAAARRAKLLDAVLDDANSLKVKLGSRDKQRLDQHLTHVRDLQARIETLAPECAKPARPDDRGDLIQKTRAMGEMVALAVGCGLTRVFSFMLTAPASTHVFNNLGVPDGMHKTCHDGHWQRVRDITRYQMEAFAAFLDAFRVPHPAGGELIDRAVVMGTSEYGEGWKHSVKELPFLMAGGGCGRLVQGVHTREPGGNYCKGHVTAMRALGLETENFGWNGAETSDSIGGFLS